MIACIDFVILIFLKESVMEDNLYCELENGTKLYTNAMTKNSDSYAKGRKLTGYRVFLAEHPDGTRVYLITKNYIPVYDNSSYENIGFYFDKCALVKSMRVKR